MRGAPREKEREMAWFERGTEEGGAPRKGAWSGVSQPRGRGAVWGCARGGGAALREKRE